MLHVLSSDLPNLHEKALTIGLITKSRCQGGEAIFKLLGLSVRSYLDFLRSLTSFDDVSAGLSQSQYFTDP